MLSLTVQKRLRNFTLYLDLEMGSETVALVGYSGSGKSTTLGILAGLTEPDEGHIQLGDTVFLDTARGINISPQARQVGFVFQNYALFPHLTVEDNLGYGLGHLQRSERHARIAWALERFGLADLRSARPGSLSGGQQQRVALARALVIRPRLLLLDEPLSALDVATRGRVRGELKELLQGLNIPSILVTHDYEDARVLGDEILVMAEGEIVQRGTAEDIQLRPAIGFVAQFVGTNLVTDGEYQRDDGRVILHQESFNPWDVKVEPAGAPDIRWTGTVLDVVRFSHLARLSVDTAQGKLLADVSLGDRAIPEIGDVVGLAVDERGIRRYDYELPPGLASASSPARVAGSRPVRPRPLSGAPIISIVGLVFVAALVSGFTWVNGHQNKTGTSARSSVTLTAFVAANATKPFNTLIREFEQRHPGVRVTASYAGTQILQTQLQQGAPDDIFLSADRSHIQQIEREGLVRRYEKVSNDKEVVVVPRANPAGIHFFQDLGSKPVQLIIGVSSVPIGQYTREIFQRADRAYGPDFSQKAMGHVVSMETNVKQILQKVAMGDGQAGIVYVTDVTPSYRGEVHMIPIPASLNLIASNYVAVPTAAPHPQLAREFVAFMLSKQGQVVFRRDGYLPLRGTH